MRERRAAGRAGTVLKKSRSLSEEELATRDKVELIDSLRPRYKLKRLLVRLDLAKSTYEYHHAKDLSRDKYAEEKRLITELFEGSRQTYGYRRIRLALRNEQGLHISSKTVRKLMNEIGVRPVQRRKGKYRSYVKQNEPPEPNLLRRGFSATEPCEKMVSDVTEFAVAGQKVYLSPMIDLFNGEVWSHAISTSPNQDFVMKMMDGLDGRLPEGAAPIFHTDQGLPYWHWRYKKKVAELGGIQSMSRKGNCLDNAAAESFFGHLKSEFFYREKFKSIPEFVRELESYIVWYNNGRIRCDLDGLSPVQYRMRQMAPT
ncbi:MAG: IS3 family transposase [Coriobacteriia bacterium]